jgi:hypothetical protein
LEKAPRSGEELGAAVRRRLFIMGVRGLRLVPWPFFVSAALIAAGAPARAHAQDPMRPWLPWRTISTAGYRLHHLPELESWTRDVAERVESIDSAVASLVGYPTRKPVQVVVDDPFNLSNGYAIPFLDKPVTVWWATPPDPHTDIGNFRVWGEMLAVHEIAHLAHLGRPSRNPLHRGAVASLLGLGPIPLTSPRWLYEGYATLIEGRITGSGRPNNVWRPAILRQWAIEGRLPTYGQLSGSGSFNGGEFPYLGGSAFLEWLVQREGDSSLVYLWRRLTARQLRGFDAAFTGVYGDLPALLYGRHVAEVTRDAMAVKAELERAGLVEGELVQRLSWATGDPAISPNGQRLAIALREGERPGRVVVWKTAAEPEDTAAVRRRIDALKRDPHDVPDRRFYPRPKKPDKVLPALNGRSYQMPRWFADNRRVLVTRWTGRDDGTLSPALYVWDTDDGEVRRVTPAVGVLHGDPHPDGRQAVAMQCHWGHCDIARVDLERGVMVTLLEGNAHTSYYRPRYSPDGKRILALVAEQGRWRVVVADAGGKNMRAIDPDDGVNRYDAQWLTDDSVIVVSERGGIANLERIGIADRSTRTLTRVTGAAVGTDVNPRDGSIWFLSMHSLGFDLRRLPSTATAADSAVTVGAARFGWAGVRGDSVLLLPTRPAGPARPYGSGPRHARWMPGGYASADGAGAFVTIFSGDVIGRLNATATGALGEPGTWQGGSVSAAWRFPRPAIEFGASGYIHEPSLGRDAQPASDSLDAAAGQAFIALTRDRRGDWWSARARVGGAAGRLAPVLGEAYSTALGFGEAALFLQRSRGARGVTWRVNVHADAGRARNTFQRTIGSLQLATTGRDALPLELGLRAGRVTGAPGVFEQFAIGGVASPVGDSSLAAQRFSMPMYPTAIAVGRAMLAWRVALPAGFWTPFFQGASVADNLYDLRKWNRAVGLESQYRFGPMPAAFLPRVHIRGGAGYTLDAPFRKRIRAYLEMRVEP